MEIIDKALSYIRPPGWPTDSFSFVWFYLAALVILYLIYYKIREHIIRRQVFDKKRVSDHSKAMTQRWKHIQQDITGVPEPEEEEVEREKQQKEFYYGDENRVKRNPMTFQRMEGRGCGLGK